MLVTTAWWSNESTSPTLGKISTSSQEIGENDFQISFMGPEGAPEFDAFRPAVAYNSTNDEFLVVWIGRDDLPLRFRVFAQRLEAGSGSFIGGKIRFADQPGVNTLGFVDVAHNPLNNEYLVCWNHFEIFFQIIDSEGHKKFPNPLQLSDMRTPDGRTRLASDPSVAYNSVENEYLVVWEGQINAGEWEILAQRIDAVTGFPLAPDDFRVTWLGEEEDRRWFARVPDVAFNSIDNNYLVVWHANPYLQDTDIYGRILEGKPSTQEPSVGFAVSEMGSNFDWDDLSGFVPRLKFHFQKET